MITTFELSGVCGTSSSTLQDATLAEPLLQSPGQHPSASAEGPSPAVLTAARQQPALPARIGAPVSKPPPEVASAAGSGFDTTSGSNDASGAHASPAPAQAHTPNVAEQKSKGSPDVSCVGITDSALHVSPFPKLESPQPAEAHGGKDQAPPGAKPTQPAGTDHSHDQHAASAATSQQAASKRSAEPPAIAEESSKTSADQPKAAADKKPVAAAAAASRDSESCSQPEATTATQVGAASQEPHGAAAAQEASPSGASATAVHSKAQVKSSAKEVSPPGRAATQQSPVRPSTEKAPAADDTSTVKGVAAKHSEVRSVAEDKRSAATGSAAKQSPAKSSAGGTSAADKHSAANGATAKQSSVRVSAAGKSLPAKDTAAKQSPVEPSADGTSAADKQSLAKQSPGRVSAADRSAPAKDTAAKQSPIEPPVVEASEAEHGTAAAGIAAKQHSAAGTAAKADSPAGEGSLAAGPVAKHSSGETPSAANSGEEAVSKSPQSMVQSTSKLNQGQQASADGADALPADESPLAQGAPTETASNRVQGTKGKDKSAGRKLDEKANKAQPQKGNGDAKKPQRQSGAHRTFAAIILVVDAFCVMLCIFTKSSIGPDEVPRELLWHKLGSWVKQMCLIVQCLQHVTPWAAASDTCANESAMRMCAFLCMVLETQKASLPVLLDTW